MNEIERAARRLWRRLFGHKSMFPDYSESHPEYGLGDGYNRRDMTTAFARAEWYEAFGHGFYGVLLRERGQDSILAHDLTYTTRDRTLLEAALLADEGAEDRLGPLRIITDDPRLVELVDSGERDPALARAWKEFDAAVARRSGGLTVELTDDPDWPDLDKLRIAMDSYRDQAGPGVSGGRR